MVYVTTCTRSDHTRSVSVHVSCVDQQCVDQASNLLGVAACRPHPTVLHCGRGAYPMHAPPHLIMCRRVVGEGQSGRRLSLEHDTPQLFRARPATHTGTPTNGSSPDDDGARVLPEQ